MYSVQFPNIVESFHRALNEVLYPFLSTGNSQSLMGGIGIVFYKCDLLYSNLIFGDEPRGNPFICFIGSQTGNRRIDKVVDPKAQRPYAYELRQNISKTVYVGMGTSTKFDPPPFEDSPRLGDMLDAENIWGQLVTVIEHQHANFAQRGIYNPRLPAIPRQVPNDNYYLVSGELTAQIRCTFTRGN